MCVCVKGMRTKNVQKWERSQPLKEGDQAREDTYLCTVWCVHARSLPSCLTLCDPTGCNPQGFPGHEILQARMLQWAVMPSLRGSSPPRNRTHSSCITGGFCTAEPPGRPIQCGTWLYSTLHSIAGSHRHGHLLFAVERTNDTAGGKGLSS